MGAATIICGFVLHRLSCTVIDVSPKDPANTSGSLIPIADARQLVLATCVASAPSNVSVDRATGFVLAQDVVSPEDVPPFANSAVDGYAVRAVDTSGAHSEQGISLRVVGEVAAGAPANIAVGDGAAIRIMTGAPMPDGADSVVMVEDTKFVGDRGNFDGSQLVQIFKEVRSGDAVRRAGDDVHAGDKVFEVGTEIRPSVAGVLASVNCRSPLVYPRVRVAVLSTGDELIDDGSVLAPGQIRESNRTMLMGLVAQAGAEAIDYGIVRDDEAALEAVLRQAATECDAIVTSGGVSMGDYDVVKAVLSRIAEMHWMQLAIKPAKPFAFGLLQSSDGRRVPVFGLPGNPVSSLVSFELLARPAIRKMAGHLESAWDRPTITAIADSPIKRSADGKVHYQRVIARFESDGRLHIDAIRSQGSHQLAASALANAIAVVPNGTGVEAGGEVPTILLVS
ncbi:MAG: molybdopterin biosynthesis protein MoeA [Actinomycetota bacterium]